MKTMHLGKYFLSIAIMAVLLFSAVNSFGARKDAVRTCVNATNGSGCTNANGFMVVAPYWQVDAGSYTFIAVTHTSLSGMASQIGLHVNAITNTGAAYDSAETFTVASGTTQRLFIVPTDHATINATAITTAKFMTGTSDFTYGSIRVEPVMTHPAMKYAQNIKQIYRGDGFRDITMLSYWGSVIIEANTTGFAMEFIGDMNDSIAMFQATHDWLALDGGCANVTTNSLGTNSAKVAYSECGNLTASERLLHQTMSTGPNLQ
jgi:hypothetical protein